MALAQGSQILADDFNALFTRLEAVRKKHYAAKGLSSAQSSALSTAIATNVAVRGKAARASNMQTLKDALTKLDNSPYIAATFANNVPIPAVGDLIKYNTISTAVAQVTAVEGLCANCAFFSSNYSSNFSSFFSSDYSSNFSSFFSSDYSSNFSSNFSSDYSSNFGSNFSSDYSSNFSNFSSNYSSNFSNFSSNFGSNFSNFRSNHGSDFTNPVSGWT